MKKKVLSILLVLAMCLTLLPATALAAEGDNYPDAGALNVQATAGPEQITVTWDALEAVDGATPTYSVYYYVGDGEVTKIPDPNALFDSETSSYSYTITSLTKDVTYEVGVEAVYGTAEPLSSEDSATPYAHGAGAPDAPTEVSATANDDGSVEVCWKAPTNDGGAAITGYEVDVSFTSGEESGGKTEAVGANATSCTIDGLTGGVTYTVVVRAINAVGSTDSTTPTTVTVPVVEYNLKVEGIPVTNVNADDVLDDGTVSYDPETSTLTLIDATINNESGNGIEAIGSDITIVGVDTEAPGSNTILGSKSAVYGTKNITFEGTFGDITGGTDGGIYSVVGSAPLYTGGNVHIAEGAVLGNISSSWYTIQADKGDIIIDGQIGNISGESGFTAEIDGDIVINGKIGDVTGKSYGMNAHKTITIAEGAEVGDITTSGLAAIISFESNVTISGKTGDISGTTYGAIAMGGALTIDGQVSQLSGQCPIFAKGDINISGTVDSITANGGAGNTGSSYGIRTDGGKINISSAIGSVSASSNGEGKTIMAMVAKNGIELADNVAIKTPANSKIDLYGTSNYTVYDTAGTEDTGDDTVATTVEFAPVYKVTFNTDGGSEIAAQTVVSDETATKPKDPTRSGYTFGGWYTDAACTTEYDFSTPVTGDVTLYAKWTQRSTGGGSSSSNTTTKTEKNEDGSTTTTTTNKTTGTVTETTKYPDGSSTTVVTTKDGEVTTTGKTADGVTGTVVTDKKGEVTEVTAAVPSAAAKEAEKTGEAVTLPIEVEAADDADEAVEIEIDVPSGGAKVEIPVEDVTPGTVVVIVNKDGTEEIVKTSTVSENGVIVTLDKDATVKVIENSKYFVDVHPVDHWATDAVDFVVAREIFGGTSANTFTPNGSMTRQAMWMVLARMSGADPANMTEARNWAVENGVSDGSNPTNAVTRQQFVTMLWRWVQSLGIDVSVGEDTNILSYNDAFDISEYAIPAMQWACGEGVMGGYADGTLRPHNTATRAHVAQMLKNFMEKAVQ